MSKRLCHSEGAKRPWESVSITKPDSPERQIKTERFGERIATPGCGLVRNDRFFLLKLPDEFFEYRQASVDHIKTHTVAHPEVAGAAEAVAGH